MATCRDVITKAWRKLGVLGFGSDPSAAQADEGLSTLQSVYDQFVLEGVFGRVIPARESAAATADENTRIFDTSGSSISITLPEEYLDSDNFTGLTTDDSGYRPPRDMAVVSIAGGGNYLYSQPRGSWDAMSSLALDDFAPLSERGEHGLAALLAVHLGSSSVNIPQIVGAQSAAFKSRVSMRFGAERTPIQADYF